jgi:hypothetical protein
MFEILFIFGVLGLFLGTCCEFLASLAAFPTLLTACAVVPLLGWAVYLELLPRFGLSGINQPRPPVPPERFYWALHRARLRAALIALAPVAVAAWAAALEWPAELAWTGSSVTGWITGAVAIVATALLAACSTIYVRASHWFDKMAPWVVGACRRSLYRLSENPDFLAPGHPDRQEEEKSIY